MGTGGGRQGQGELWQGELEAMSREGRAGRRCSMYVCMYMYVLTL